LWEVIILPAKRDPFKRVVKVVRVRPWLKDLDITRLARKLEAWSLQAMELERDSDKDPPDKLAKEIGHTVIRLIQEALGFKEKTYRKPEKKKKKLKGD
jgi:hypothetical protein